ncbi:S1C family serine protease [Longispora fulva]|uniref:Putative serine protease PepD n=1 Tax=Longispora fulva TaxID=619741 RepID=A0A8J7KTP0_9ACTN|nr:trypsin-like peptidase domain-containing protein [Longispora fulva]MBG6140952.1 putative serine protease PepD [Longispora fulva]
MSSDETNRDQQSTTVNQDPSTPTDIPATTPAESATVATPAEFAPAASVTTPAPAESPTVPAPAATAERIDAPAAQAAPGEAAAVPAAPTEALAVTPEQLADAVRAQAERSEALRGDLEQGAYTAPTEVARETNLGPAAASHGAPAAAPTPGHTPGWSPATQTTGQYPTSGHPQPVFVPAPGQPGAPQPLSGPGGPAGPPYYPGGHPMPAFAQQPTPRKKMGTLPKVLIGTAAALVLAVTAGTVGGVVGFALGDSNSGSSVVQTSTGRAVTNGGTLADVANQALKSVVGVKTATGEGSGVVFNKDGYIVTNNHVIAGARGQIQVTLPDGKTVPATLVGTDPTNDLAVLKIDGVDGLEPILFADSSAVKVGDDVLAIGNPLGLDGTVTKGILSARDRTIDEGSDTQSQSQGNRLSGLLQTDAAINPGNSGGALTDAAGRLIGINTAIATGGSGSKGNIGVGFAIPSNKVKSVVEQLMKGGKVGHPYIGVRVLNSTTQAGAVVDSTDPNSPAAQAGLAKGDLITGVNGKPVKNQDELISAIQSGNPGDKLTLTVVRDGKTVTVPVTVGSSPTG